MATIFYDKDADLKFFKGKKIAVIGYGSQGHAQALNMRDSGVEVIVAELKGTENYDRAVEAGFEPLSAADAAQQADVVHFLAPDQVQKMIYDNEVKAHLKPGNAIAFSHGFNIHFNCIVPPKDIDVYMVAPKGPGHLVRRQFEEGKGVPCLVAVEQDASGNALNLALAHAKAIGGTRSGVIQTTFKEETETDLFGEQVILCGGLTSLIYAAYETLVDAGYQPETAYFECLHELKLITDLIHENGISMMRYSISDTAEYGDLTRGPRIINKSVREEIKKILAEIQSGEFAREWILENQAGRPMFNLLRKQGLQHPIEKIGKELRKMMPWLSKTK